MVFKAIVIMCNANTNDLGSIIAMARSEARKREKSEENLPIRALQFVAELGVFVAVYEAIENINLDQKNAKVN